MMLEPAQKGHGPLWEFWGYIERDRDGDEDFMVLEIGFGQRIAAIFRTKELADEYRAYAKAHAERTGHLVYLTSFRSSGMPL